VFIVIMLTNEFTRPMQPNYLAGTQASWGKYDVEVYTRFNETLSGTSLRLLNQFIRLYQIDVKQVRESIEGILRSILVTHKQEVVKELDRIMADRKFSSDGKIAMKRLISLLVYPGFMLLPLKVCVHSSLSHPTRT
jgi:hypothetical protein